jgi:hypothetical protein
MVQHTFTTHNTHLEPDRIALATQAFIKVVGKIGNLSAMLAESFSTLANQLRQVFGPKYQHIKSGP